MWYILVKESLYTQVIIWLKTILNYIDTRGILPRYEDSCMVYRPEWYWKQKYCQIPIPYVYYKCEILILDTQMVLKKRRYQIDTDAYLLQHRAVEELKMLESVFASIPSCCPSAKASATPAMLMDKARLLHTLAACLHIKHHLHWALKS